MFIERKKLVGFRKAVSKKGSDYATLYFSEVRSDVRGEATSNVNIFNAEAVSALDDKWIGNDVELVYVVNYGKNTVFLIDVKPVNK